MMSFLAFLLVMYWLPTIVAVLRQSPAALGIAALNFFLGWTVIGWILAIVWALASQPHQRVVIIDSSGRVVG